MTPRSKLLGQEIRHSFTQEVAQPENAIQLERAALLIAAEEEAHARVDINECLSQIDNWGELARERISSSANGETQVEVFNRFIFEELGFAGNELDYYDPRNSYLHQVMKRRTGIPITLSIIYMAIARRAGLEVVGVGLPGHFIVRATAPDSLDHTLVDPFHGTTLEREDCQERLDEIYSGEVRLSDEHLRAARTREILVRLLTNLKTIYAGAKLYRRALSVVERILILTPGAPAEHRDRGALLAQLDRLQEAIAEAQLYLQLVPSSSDTEQVREVLKSLQRRQAEMQ